MEDFHPQTCRKMKKKRHELTSSEINLKFFWDQKLTFWGSTKTSSSDVLKDVPNNYRPPDVLKEQKIHSSRMAKCLLEKQRPKSQSKKNIR